MQRTRKINPKPAGQRKGNFFQKLRNTSSNQFKPDPKSTRASEETGNEFFLKPSTTSPEQLADPSNTTTKRPFDKKAWRLQKYSKKYKLDQWENRRKNTILREYYRQIDPNEKKLDVEKIYQQYDEIANTEITAEENDNDNNVNAANNIFPATIDNSDLSAVGHNKRMSKGKNAYQKAHNQLARMKEEKLLKKEEVLKRKLEKEEKLKLYKQKKDEKSKRLNKKTKRGQPVMKDRLEMLLEQIQNNM